MSNMQIQIVRNEMAARITGLDLSRGVEDLDWTELEALWNGSHALIFPGQHGLTTEAQVAFLERFGPVIEERIPGDKHSYVSNSMGRGTDDMNLGYRVGELTAHMDYTYTPHPADVISLYAEELPVGGSSTIFYSNVAPLAKMPASLRRELERYTLFCAHDLAQMKPDARLYQEGRTVPDAPTQSYEWPMIRSHPHKPGVEMLFCTLQQTERIVELSNEANDDRESRELLDRIFHEFLYTPGNEYEHVWQIGDLVVWDNLALQHARRACPIDAGVRTFRRVAVCESGNAIQDTVDFLGLSDSSVSFA
jgi:taurine dioxygenase